jgi:hypothetical protein
MKMVNPALWFKSQFNSLSIKFNGYSVTIFKKKHQNK